MQITKKIESEILQVMDDYWDSYLRGDLQTWASYLPDDYRNIGSTKEEIWNSKKEIVDYTNSLYEQIVGMAELRNKKTQIIPYDPYLMVHELGDIYVKAEEGWVFYAPMRLSSLLEKTTDGWKVLHQHGSYPDSKTEEGEAFAFDELKAENKKLRDAIQARTIELERKNRELEVETALERVRTVAMSMSKSEDLLQICEVTFHELQKLGFNQIRNATIHIINDEQKYLIDYDFSSLGGGDISKVTYDLIPFIEEYRSNIKSPDGNLFELVIEGEKLEEWQNLRKSVGQEHDPQLDETDALYYYLFSIGIGDIGISTFQPVNEDQLRILKRFRNVFGLAYKRYTDITLAEAQAREAQIETALERVRAKTMAMHHTSELQDVINTVHQQFRVLDIAITGGVFVAINEENEKELNCWGAGDTAEYVERVKVPFFNQPIYTDIIKIFNNRQGLFIEEFTHREKIEFFRHLFKHPPYNNAAPNRKKEILSRPGGYTRSCYVSKFTSIFMINHHGREFEEEENNILIRFGKVFEQTYTRFLDLQKAEAQARDKEIELGLERIRSKAMAMQKSEDLADLSLELVQQVQNLDIEPWFCAFNISDEKGGIEWGSNGQDVFPKYRTPRENIFLEYYNARQSGTELYVRVFDEKECPVHYEYLCTLPGVGEQLLKMKEVGISFPASQIDHVAFFKYGYILFITFDPVPESHDIFKRFAKVFEQAYTRFLDLQRAEAQAREAQIEAALERIRAQSMMMQHSEELSSTSNVFHQQLLLLGLESEFSYVWLPDEPNESHMFWATWSKNQNGSVTFHNKAITYPLDKKEPYTAACFEMWESDEYVFVNRIQPEEVEDFFSTWSDLVSEAENLQADKFPDGLYYAEAYMKYGCFGINIRRPLDEGEQEVLRRFANEFERTYTRFLDLHKAEEQAREAQIEAALERVRSRSMAMHQSEELREVIACVFEELQKLDFVAPACSLIFYKENLSAQHWFAGFTEGAYPQSYTIPYIDIPYYVDLLKAWQDGLEYKEFIMEGKAKVDYAKWLLTKTDFKDLPKEFVEGSGMKTPAPLYFSDAYNKYGMLEIIGNEPLAEDKVHIVKRMSKVFEQTYTRFLDLQTKEKQAARLAEEKQRLEKTLHDLQITQKQLIQAEKMASLGELTAGIAHEIQNPLNFVNNFSEVSSELIEEMQEEMEKGDLEEVKAIAEDIRQNLEKINTHGKRADSIVKGMLQHSRQSSSEKAPTDINKLADEYLRLAYHGLRAKDKSFNATLETDFDENLGKIMVVPQDIGRVILNIVTNAFYAVHEKKKAGANGYQPMVAIRTASDDNEVRITVKDNGDGIPQHIIDKIFQPFFTTKPTGEGTGLGLSLCYDIVRAHNGKLEVETVEGDHTVFEITLPK